MRSMGIDRRRVLGLMAATVAGAGSPLAAFTTDQVVATPRYLAARRSAGRYESVVIDGQGRDTLVIPMPDRGHSFAIDAPRNRAVAFGRQPGFFAVAFDLAGRQPPYTFDAAPQRHFFGHGIFSPDGKLMVATENDYEAGRGVLGVYDASRQGIYKRVGEYASGGVGPHEVVLMPDGRTLCVANGGILTHPDYGKLQLNADTMRPSLAYIDLFSGQLLEQIFRHPDLNRLSIRHLVVDARGAVWFGCQHTGDASDRPPLVGRHQRGAATGLFAGPDETLRGLKNYVGSLAISADGRTIATSSPVGGRVAFWEALSGDSMGVSKVFDGCGVAPARKEGFLITSGQGSIDLVGRDRLLTAILPPSTGVAWDNHLRLI